MGYNRECGRGKIGCCNLARFGSLLETGAEEKSTSHTYNTCMHMYIIVCLCRSGLSPFFSLGSKVTACRKELFHS